MASSPGAFLKEVPVGSYVHVEKLPGTRSAAKTAASRAAARGELVPLRRGLYYKGALGRYGVATPPPEDVALEVMGRKGVGPAGVSAARAFGVTTQVPPTPELVTSGPVPEGLHGVKVHKRNNAARRDLSYLEIAALELLRDYEFTAEVDWKQVVKVILEKVRTHEIRPDSLLEVGARERNRALRERLDALASALAEKVPSGTGGRSGERSTAATETTRETGTTGGNRTSNTTRLTDKTRVARTAKSVRA